MNAIRSGERSGNAVAVEFVQLADGTVYTVWERRGTGPTRARREVRKTTPTRPCGMSDEEAEDAWEAHLAARANV
jgi:hypothetical protein